ncbi:MAG: Trk system potassium transport protein TrkA [Steroidobacteraceae bacterium]
MKIVILGAGQVGRTAAYHLSREEANDVTVVDSNEEVLRDLQGRLDIRTVAGNAAFPTVLDSAGAAGADVLIALTNSDEVNMLACEVAYTLYRTPTKIARIRSAEYTGNPKLFSAEALSVDVWISPEQLVTEYIERLIRYPGALHVLPFGGGQARLVGVRVGAGVPLAGQPIRRLREHLPDLDARIVALYRDGRRIDPEADTVIETDDEVFFIAARDSVRRVLGELRAEDNPARRIVIAGGGSIGLRLARALERTHHVKLIERDAKRARHVSEVLEEAIVLHGDAADEELLIEENIDGADVFAAVTNSEEANILSAMLAKRLGANKVMALINKPSYAELMESGSIDVAISPQTVTLGSLLAHVRRGDVVRVHSLRHGTAEAMEAIAHGEAGRSRTVGLAVDAIPMPDGARIGAITRGSELILAHHDTVVQDGDHVIIFLADRRHVDQVERLFMANGTR